MNNNLNNRLEFFDELIKIPGVAGYCYEAIDFCKKKFKDLGLEILDTNKGGFYAILDGNDNSQARIVCAHVDTLGAMVSSIKPNGRIKFVTVGGYSYGSVEAENCIIHTRSGELEGSVLPEKASVHIYGDEARKLIRDENSVEIRIDKITYSIEDTMNLGVRVGDFITFDTRTRYVGDFIKSRYLDDRLAVAELYEAVKDIVSSGKKPAYKTYIYITDYEEVGCGTYAFPEDAREIVAIDIGTVGGDRNSDERAVTIAAKDRVTPYPYKLRRKLENLCEENNIPYKTDVNIFYSSDASMTSSRGLDMTFACFGPAVDATHHYERTTIQSHLGVIDLIKAYLFCN